MHQPHSSFHLRQTCIRSIRPNWPTLSMDPSANCLRSTRRLDTTPMGWALRRQYYPRAGENGSCVTNRSTRAARWGGVFLQLILRSASLPRGERRILRMWKRCSTLDWQIPHKLQARYLNWSQRSKGSSMRDFSACSARSNRKARGAAKPPPVPTASALFADGV